MTQEPPMSDPDQVLEENLAIFISELEPELERLRELAPRFVALFTETTLSVLTLEHALRKKGVLAADEMTQAVIDAQDALQRIRARRRVAAAGTA
jgi:hypothetical protein